jgi:hypothetical protein
MQKGKFHNITTERELQVMLLEMEKRWAKAYRIKNPRRRFKEVLRVRADIRILLDACNRMRRTANSSDINEGFFAKAFKTMVGWLSGMEKKYKDV